jgi:hypothetical protein
MLIKILLLGYKTANMGWLKLLLWLASQRAANMIWLQDTANMDITEIMLI